MSVKFKVSGPFEIPYRGAGQGHAKHIDPSHGRAFWEEDASEFAMKQGCYVFALRTGGGYYIPWYVGKTKNILKGECFTTHKLGHYNRVVFDMRGTPVLFFVTRSDGKKNIPKDMLKQVEIFLIQAAKLKNDDLVNTQHTKNIPTWSIAGVVRSGQGESSKLSDIFRYMLNLWHT